MKEISLSKGRFALVDDEDYEWLNQYKWCYHRAGYACRNSKSINGQWKTLMMHREINHTPLGIGTDHIDGNPLNNQKSNLRTATQSQNQANSAKRKDNTSGLKGVSWLCPSKKWQARIAFNRQDIYLGVYNTKEDAARAYDAKAHELFGEYARLNFGGNDNE